MKRIIRFVVFALVALAASGSTAWAVDCQYNATQPTIPNQQFIILQCDTNGNLRIVGTASGGAITANIGTGGLGSAAAPLSVAPLSSASLTTPSSVLTRPANTTAYAVGNLIASNVTAGSVVVPSFNIATSGGHAVIPRLRLATNATTGWSSITLQVTLFTTAPTYANGDGGAYAIATGSANIIARYQVALSQFGDSAWGDAINITGSSPVVNPSAAAIYWDMQVVSGTPTPISGQTFTLTPEIWN
jgi:hypothetical protein